jgi:hypothetical protein
MPELRRRSRPQGVRAADGRLQGLGLGEGRSALEQHGLQARNERRVVEAEGERSGRARSGRRGQRLDVSNEDGLMPAASDWITLAEVAEILAASNIRFTPATIGSWARAGRLQSIKLGGRRFVRRGEVRALVAGPRRVRAEDVQPGLFEDVRG